FYGAVFDLLREIELGAKLLRNLRAERNQFFFAGRDVQAVKFSVVGVDDFLAAGEKRIAGKKIAREAGFLIVSRDGIFHPAVFAGFEGAQAARGFVTRDVQERGAVGSEYRPHAAAKLANQDIFVAGLAVAPRYLPERKLRFVREAAVTLRVVKIFSVGGGDHAERVVAFLAARGGRWLGFCNLHARAALGVIHPDFKRVNAEARFGDENVLTVRSPVWRSKFRVGILGDLSRLAAVGLHDPDVFAAFAVGKKCDPFAVGRESRLAVEGHSAVDQLGLAAFDGNRVNVADQFQDHGLAVRRDVGRHPGSFIGGELDFALGLELETFLLVLFFILLFVFFVLDLRRQVLPFRARRRRHGSKNCPQH